MYLSISKVFLVICLTLRTRHWWLQFCWQYLYFDFRIRHSCISCIIHTFREPFICNKIETGTLGLLKSLLKIHGRSLCYFSKTRKDDSLQWKLLGTSRSDFCLSCHQNRLYSIVHVAVDSHLVQQFYVQNKTAIISFAFTHFLGGITQCKSMVVLTDFPLVL